MRYDLTEIAIHSDFRREVERRSGQTLGDCYQCGKCSGGCPVFPDNELSPNRVIRKVQLGLRDEVLGNPAIWCCTACGTCDGRCPMGISIVRILDALRQMAEDKHTPRGALEVWTFYQSFLDCIRQYGRLSEIGLMGGYNINSARLWTNVLKAPWFLLKGKLTLSPHRVRRMERLKRVFERIEEIEGE